MNHETPASPSATSAARLWQRRGWKLALFVGLAGAAISLALGWVLAAQEQKLTKERFQALSGRRIGLISRALTDRLGMATTLAAFFKGSSSVVQDEFRTFTAPILQAHPGIEFMAWVPSVGAGRPLDRLPLMFVEPTTKHKSLIDFDLGSSAACRAAIERATATRRTTIAVAPPLDRDKTSPLLLYTFLLAREGETPGTQPSGAHAHVDGVVVVASRIDALIENALSVLPSVGIDIYITTPSGEPIYLRPAPAYSNHAPFVAGETPPRVGGVEPLVGKIEVADSRWRVTCIPATEYLAQQRTWAPVGTVLAGLLITALAVGCTLLLTGRTVRVERLVARRTRELAESEQRFRRLVENASDAFFLRDEQGNILDVNKRACDSLGYTHDELLAVNVRELDAQFPENRARFNQMPSDRFPVTLEGRHRRKDGSTFPVEVRLAALDTEEGRLMLALARDISDRKRAEEELHREQRRLRELLDLHERDRKVVAYEIHDGLAQQLAAAIYRFQSVPRLLDGDPAAAQGMFESALQMLREAMGETRRLISGLRPPVLDESGVVAAVDSLIAEQQRQGGPEIEFVHGPQFDRLPPPLESAVFRIVQECLTNACRYSQSPKVRVELAISDGRVRIDVRDWGVGFNPADMQGGHFGLRGICERARLLGGAATIEAAPQAGAHIAVDLPLTPREDDTADDENS